jgi:hypothetical protein
MTPPTPAQRHVRQSLYAAMAKWKADYITSVKASLIAGEITPDEAEQRIAACGHAKRMIQAQIVYVTGGNMKTNTGE